MNRLNKTKSAISFVSLMCSLLPEGLQSELIFTVKRNEMCSSASKFLTSILRETSFRGLLRPGPGCSKLTSLVIVSLKFQSLTLISEIRLHIFMLEKCEKLLLFFQKKYRCIRF